MEKKLSEITRKEWISLRWLEVTELGSERTFIPNGARTPDEAAQAMEEWDMTAEERGVAEKEGAEE
ncbi:MAG: hypothetical protein WC436_06010 [Candidatus Babeliales bacterium]